LWRFGSTFCQPSARKSPLDRSDPDREIRIARRQCEDQMQMVPQQRCRHQFKWAIPPRQRDRFPQAPSGNRIIKQSHALVSHKREKKRPAGLVCSPVVWHCGIVTKESVGMNPTLQDFDSNSHTVGMNPTLL
jgi:hypothetical protein